MGHHLADFIIYGNISHVEDLIAKSLNHLSDLRLHSSYNSIIKIRKFDWNILCNKALFE